MFKISVDINKKNIPLFLGLHFCAVNKIERTLNNLFSNAITGFSESLAHYL
jgi:hypothetical protein